MKGYFTRQFWFFGARRFWLVDGEKIIPYTIHAQHFFVRGALEFLLQKRHSVTVGELSNTMISTASERSGVSISNDPLWVYLKDSRIARENLAPEKGRLPVLLDPWNFREVDFKETIWSVGYVAILLLQMEEELVLDGFTRSSGLIDRDSTLSLQV